MVYIKVKDSNGNYNIWRITGKTKKNQQNMFKIERCSYVAYVEQEHCYKGSSISSLLCYDIRAIDFDAKAKTYSEIETEGEYFKYLKERNTNINPFKVFKEIDLGYIEDIWDEYREKGIDDFYV